MLVMADSDDPLRWLIYEIQSLAFSGLTYLRNRAPDKTPEDDLEYRRKLLKDVEILLQRVRIHDEAREKPVKPDEEPDRRSCEGFRTWGSIQYGCERCGRYAWEHKGMEGRIITPLPWGGGTEIEREPIQPWGGLMAEVREAYLKGLNIEILPDPNRKGMKVLHIDRSNEILGMGDPPE